MLITLLSDFSQSSFHYLCLPILFALCLWLYITGGWFPLGSLRPDLYQLPEEPSEWAQPSGSTVRLCFAVQYQQEQEQLVVSLLQAANLPAHCQSNATLVKLQLLPSEDRHHRQAKARCKGCQPQLNDTFVFQVYSVLSCFEEILQRFKNNLISAAP